MSMQPSSNQPQRSAPIQVKPWTPPHVAPDVTLYKELGRAADGPGEMFNMMRGKHLEDVRDEYEKSPAAKGVKYEMRESGGSQRAKVLGFEDIPAPKGADGKPGQWDPATFAPHYVFDKREDAFPVRPDYDGNGSTADNGAKTLAGTGSDHYRDGVIDKQQALSSGFVVSQKGEYTVLTYSTYYPTNKGATYHNNDYSTAQVYLKPDEKGELKPEFLATSWHYGTQLTPWKDVKKDAQGHPVVQVGLGTHSLQPLGKDQAIPKDGLHIQGDGTSTLNGEPTAQRLTYDAFQSNVANATILDDSDSDRATARRTTLGYGWTAADPLDPKTFFKDNTAKQVEARIGGDYDDVEKYGGDVEGGKKALTDAARRAGVKDPEAHDRGFFGKIAGFFGF